MCMMMQATVNKLFFWSLTGVHYNEYYQSFWTGHHSEGLLRLNLLFYMFPCCALLVLWKL